jgi:hypothetical protein
MEFKVYARNTERGLYSVQVNNDGDFSQYPISGGRAAVIAFISGYVAGLRAQAVAVISRNEPAIEYERDEDGDLPIIWMN